MQDDLGFDGLEWFSFGVWGVFLALGRLVAADFPAWQATHLSGQLPWLSPTCCAVLMLLTVLLSRRACALTPSLLLPRKTASPAWAWHSLCWADPAALQDLEFLLSNGQECTHHLCCALSAIQFCSAKNLGSVKIGQLVDSYPIPQISPGETPALFAAAVLLL